MAVFFAALLAAAPVSARRPSQVTSEPKLLSVTLFADTDDDDANGEADAAQEPVVTSDELFTVDDPLARSTVLEHIQGESVRVLSRGRPVLPSAAPRPFDKLVLQGIRAGRARVKLAKVAIEASVVGVSAFDATGAAVDLATSHASLSRVLPDRLGSGDQIAVDQDALRWLVMGPKESLPSALDFAATRPNASALDTLLGVPLSAAACPPDTAAELECKVTPFVRATSDLVDRSHPGSSSRSIRAEVGGKIVVSVGGRKAAAIRVGGPRQSAIGPLGRYRARLRVRILKLGNGGTPAVGGSDSGAIALATEEVHTASGLWGQCGIHFGYGRELDIAVVEPPPPHLLAVGCDLGLPASGGEVRVRAAGKRVRVATKGGQSPTEVAGALAGALRAAGLTAVVSANVRIAPGALRTVDVLVRGPDGGYVDLKADDGGTGSLSTDPTLNVCLGEVDLDDGLTHFTDFDAVAGTVEERSLIKAFDDGNPSTIEVFIIPNFALTGRIGESFIHADGSSVRNAVIIDRAAVRAGARSFALAHELGHILLDMPGHPDDFGVDSSTSLMDADAADPTIFGPRRLTVGECERAIIQSGPKAPIPLLGEWPLYGASRPVKAPAANPR